MGLDEQICPECFMLVPRRAHSCPHCGYVLRSAGMVAREQTLPFSKRPSNRFSRLGLFGQIAVILGSLFAVAVVCGVLVGGGDRVGQDEAAPTGGLLYNVRVLGTATLDEAVVMLGEPSHVEHNTHATTGDTLETHHYFRGDTLSVLFKPGGNSITVYKVLGSFGAETLARYYSGTGEAETVNPITLLWEDAEPFSEIRMFKNSDGSVNYIYFASK